MPTVSRIDSTMEITEGFWIVSKVLHHGHTIIVFEGLEPTQAQGRFSWLWGWARQQERLTWLWGCDFVPAKYRYNDMFGGQNLTYSYAINVENTIGTPGVVRTSRPYGNRAHHQEKYFTLSDRHFAPGHYKSKSWRIAIDRARAVQQEINHEEHDGNAPMYQWLGDRSLCSHAVRWGCSAFFGGTRKTGFNCESWVVDKLEKCGIKDARTSWWSIFASIPSV